MTTCPLNLPEKFLEEVIFKTYMITAINFEKGLFAQI
jgi:hypothetical protein